MKQPLEPSREDCCNSGCNPCIFDVYEKQLTLYNFFLECGESASNVIEENGISQLEYTPFVVVDNINLCNSHSVLTLRRQKLNDNKVSWKPGQHFLFKYEGPGSICTRAYTPIHFKIDSSETFEFAIIIKKYENGLVSSYLFNLKKGTQTLWRGPYGSYEINRNKFARIFMVAQGTGIAPFISIIKKVLNDDEDITRIILLYCCQSIDTILFRDELYNLKLYWNFTYHLYISEFETNIKLKYQEPVVGCKLSHEAFDQFQPYQGNEQFLLCGSSQFMDYYKLFLLEKNVATENIILF